MRLVSVCLFLSLVFLSHAMNSKSFLAPATQPSPSLVEKQSSECTHSTDKFKTSSSKNTHIEGLLSTLKSLYPHQPTFLQAVEETAKSLQLIFDDEEHGDDHANAFLVMCEPERSVSFRIKWVDDKGVSHFNRGWRIQFNSALGPYKGGLRFHPSVTEDVLKFLGFEQVFKNALTGLPLGGGKGGSDFDPKGKSDGEVLRFCQAFMTELARHIGPSTDIPAGDIGVGGREIGYMYGQYKLLTNRHGEGVLTGKSILFGGSPLRPQATGYGVVYMAEEALRGQGIESISGKRCVVSGSGNVATYCAEKLMQLGAIVISMSDSSGTMVWEHKSGMSQADLYTIMHAKNVDRARLSSLCGKVGSGRYLAGHSPWTAGLKNVHLAFPCATQNEVNAECARSLVEAGLEGYFEGANMPSTLEAQFVIRDAKGIVYVPSKAANAGGVAVSGLEMSQNSQRLTWAEETVDEKLRIIMKSIYADMKNAGGVECNLEAGANISAFLKVFKAMEELGML